MKSLNRAFFEVAPVTLAPLLLNKVLVHGEMSGRIVEVEAYDGDKDEASHAYRGETPRNSVMFDKPGLLYVYFTYGMHFCCNVTCYPEGTAGAVLIRALAPLTGIEQMRANRPKAKPGDRHLCSGPAKLCQALGIDRDQNGADLLRAGGGVRLLDDGTPPPSPFAEGPRIGIKHAVTNPWRFWVPGDSNVSG